MPTVRFLPTAALLSCLAFHPAAAQVALPNGQGYASGKYISSFIGYLPADDPQLLIEVKIDEPSGVIFGGVVAAPTFSRLAQFCCDHLR